jgi:hypothetical protein
MPPTSGAEKPCPSKVHQITPARVQRACRARVSGCLGQGNGWAGVAELGAGVGQLKAGVAEPGAGPRTCSVWRCRSRRSAGWRPLSQSRLPGHRPCQRSRRPARWLAAGRQARGGGGGCQRSRRPAHWLAAGRRAGAGWAREVGVGRRLVGRGVCAGGASRLAQARAHGSSTPCPHLCQEHGHGRHKHPCIVSGRPHLQPAAALVQGPLLRCCAGGFDPRGLSPGTEALDVPAPGAPPAGRPGPAPWPRSPCRCWPPAAPSPPLPAPAAPGTVPWGAGGCATAPARHGGAAGRVRRLPQLPWRGAAAWLRLDRGCLWLEPWSLVLGAARAGGATRAVQRSHRMTSGTPPHLMASQALYVTGVHAVKQAGDVGRHLLALSPAPRARTQRAPCLSEPPRQRRAGHALRRAGSCATPCRARRSWGARREPEQATQAWPV